MFLRDRATQAEYLDEPVRTPAELRRHYLALARVNQLTCFHRPFRMWLPQLLGPEACQRLTALDLGAGDGSLGRQLTAWAFERKWHWEFTNLDVNPITTELDPNPRQVIGSVTDLPFSDASFDVVIATTMTHHLATDAEVVAHFREAARVSRRVILLCDLHRNIVFLAGLWALMLAAGLPREFRADGTLSIRRGWRTGEWQRLAVTK